MSESVEESSGGAAMVGVLDVVLVLFFVVVVVLIVMRFRRKRAEQNKLKDLRINTTINIGRQVSVYDEPLNANFLDKMKNRNKKVVVFYGSQTGTAEEFASRLSKEATRHGLPAMTFDPEECTEWEDLVKMGSEIENSLAIFVMATYGEGDPTDNAQEFDTWLKETDVNLSSLK